MVNKGGKNLIDYKYSMQCGLTGSLAACSAKVGIQPENTIYKHLDGAFPFSIVVAWIIRISFISLMFWWNIKMLEFKLRSFAAIGSSMTVVVAFQSNYFFMLMYEIIFFQQFPNLASLIGSMFCLAGIFILKDQVAPVDNDLQEQEEGKERVDDQSISTKENDKTLSVNSEIEEKDLGGNFISSNDDRQIEFAQKRDAGETVHEEGPRMRVKTPNPLEVMCFNNIDI